MRLLGQITFLFAASFVLAFGANTLRSGTLPWAGSDPDELKWRDLDWIAVDEAAARQEHPDVLFLDARAPDEFEKLHVFGAVNLPADDLERAWAELRDFVAPDMTLIVYADNANLASRVYKFLVQREMQAQVLRGGWVAWEQARLPMDRGGA